MIYKIKQLFENETVIEKVQDELQRNFASKDFNIHAKLARDINLNASTSKIPIEESLIGFKNSYLVGGSIEPTSITKSKQVRDIRDVESHEAKAGQGLDVGGRSIHDGTGSEKHITESTQLTQLKDNNILNKETKPVKSHYQKTVKEDDGTIKKEKFGKGYLKKLNTNLSIKNGDNASLKQVQPNYAEKRRKNL